MHPPHSTVWRLLPQIESHAEHRLSAEHPSGISGFLLVHYRHIELAQCPEKKAVVGAIPYHRQIGAVIQRERYFFDIGVHKSLAHSHHRRLTHTKHPMACEDPVIAISQTHGIVMCIHTVVIVIPVLRQLIAQILRQPLEVEIEFLGVDRKTGIESTLTLALNSAEIERRSLRIPFVIEEISPSILLHEQGG